MTRLELERFSTDWDRRAATDPDADPFCTRSAWSLAFHDAFEPERPLYRLQSGSACVVLAESKRSNSAGLLEPLENMWGFGSPLIGPGAGPLLAEAMVRQPRPLLLLGGPSRGGALDQFVDLFEGAFAFNRLEPTTRFVASLEGGIDGWLSRRSASFRRNLRSAERRWKRAGLTLRRLAPTSSTDLSSLYLRLLDVESRSWKGQAGEGADQDPMRSFYAGLLPRLQASGALRVILVEQEGRLMGYLHGGVVDSHFRGLQFSFDEKHRSISLGHLMQLEMLSWLSEDGVQTYDLGGQSAYKARWAEDTRISENFLMLPRRLPDSRN
ncbi:MAG: GNAT family N-acetyltransferase [Myxococcota bacterium]|nr:GNAT family N-acetyltransferase [Myxococcota bacterium]